MENKQSSYRKFSKEEKLAIIAEAETNGVIKTLEKYDLFPGTFYYWKNNLKAYGHVGALQANSKQLQAENKKLLNEIRVLKELLAEKELEARLKDELLKKSIRN